MTNETEKLIKDAIELCGTRYELEAGYKHRLLSELAHALLRAETELDEAKKDAASVREAAKHLTQETQQIAHLRASVAGQQKRAEKAEAERDAQHEQVLRLTGERNALVFHGAEIEQAMLRAGERRDELLEKIEELEATRDLLLIENAKLQQMLSGPDPVVHETPVDGVVPCCGQKLHDLKDGARVNEGPLVNCDRMRALARVGELTSTNLLLTAENALLQKERDAALSMEADTARRSSAEIDALKAELNEARGEIEDLNRRVAELHGQRQEARKERDEAHRQLERIANPPIKRLHVEDGELDVVLDAPEMARIIAEVFYDALDEHNAENYLELTCAVPEEPQKRVVITVRKILGKTPHEMRKQAERERDEARSQVATLELLRRGGK